MNYKRQKLASIIPTFIGLALFIVLFVIGIIFFSYLLIIGAIIGLILFLIGFIRAKFFMKGHRPIKQQPQQHRGRTIDHDKL